MTTCPYFCINKTDLGYCKTTVCINPKYNCLSVTKWLEKADYVQVVRCKDCKHYYNGFCEQWADLHAYAEEYPNVDANGYCHYGERKDDETD